MKDIFTAIYKENRWGVGSGPGSDPVQAAPYMSYLQLFLKHYNIRSVVDAGCGDWRFSSKINWDGVQYLGLDIVSDIVSQNTKKYGSANVSFQEFDITSPMPEAELLIVKDVFVHWPNWVIMKFLAQFSRYKYVLVTNDVETKDGSRIPYINFGFFVDPNSHYHAIDLASDPFNLFCVPVLRAKIGPQIKYTYLVFDTKQASHFYAEKVDSTLINRLQQYKENFSDTLFVHHADIPHGEYWPKMAEIATPILTGLPSNEMKR